MNDLTHSSAALRYDLTGDVQPIFEKFDLRGIIRRLRSVSVPEHIFLPTSGRRAAERAEKLMSQPTIRKGRRLHRLLGEIRHHAAAVRTI